MSESASQLYVVSDPKKVIHTQLCMDCGEFDSYQVGVETEVTFCLKELRVSALCTFHFSIPPL